MRKKRRDLWATDDEFVVPARTTETTQATRTTQRVASEDPPVRLTITYASGRESVFMREEISADNPEIKALANIRPFQRFWRLNLAIENPKYHSDEQILDKAREEGIKTSDPVVAGEALNYIAEYYTVNTRGERVAKISLAGSSDPAPADASSPT